MFKLVPYLTPKQRWGVLFGYLTLLAAVTLVARAVTGSDQLLFMLLVVAVMFASFGAFEWWSQHNCPPVPPEERRLLYAAELLNAPAWQASLMYALICAFPAWVITATRDSDIESEALFLTIVIPLGYLAGAAAAYFARRRAEKLLRAADRGGS